MSAVMEFSIARSNAMLDAGLADDDSKIELRTGSSPGVGSAATGTLLASIDLESPAWSAAAGGEKALVPPGETAAVANGVAGYARGYAANGTTAVWDVAAGGSNPIVSVDIGTDVITFLGTLTQADGDEVELFTRGAGVVPGNTAVRTSYWVRDKSGATCKLAATPGGAAIDLTAGFSGGSGSDQVRMKDADVGVAVLSVDGSVAMGVPVEIVVFTVRRATL